MIKRLILASLLTAAWPSVPAFGQDALVPVAAGQEDGKIVLTMPRQDAEGIA